MYHSSRARLLPFFLSWYQKPSLRTAVLPRPGSGARLRHRPGLVWTRLTNVMGGRSRLCAGRRIAFAQCKRNQPPRIASSAACLGSCRPKKDPGTTCMVPAVQNMVPPVLAMLWSTASSQQWDHPRLLACPSLTNKVMSRAKAQAAASVCQCNLYAAAPGGGSTTSPLPSAATLNHPRRRAAAAAAPCCCLPLPRCAPACCRCCAAQSRAGRETYRVTIVPTSLAPSIG